MDILQVVIQGGAVGLAAYAMFVMNKITSNHISHSTEAITEFTKVMSRLDEFLRDKFK